LLKYFAIAIGGALGALARYGVGSIAISRLGGRFWYGTFIINMTACVIIGFSLTYLGRRQELSPFWRYLVPVGFVGAYSTFSTFEWETYTWLQSGTYLLSAVYIVASIVVGLICVWLGVVLGRVIS
jgi:CrcB protein